MNDEIESTPGAGATARPPAAAWSEHGPAAEPSGDAGDGPPTSAVPTDAADSNGRRRHRRRLVIGATAAVAATALFAGSAGYVLGAHFGSSSSNPFGGRYSDGFAHPGGGRGSNGAFDPFGGGLPNPFGGGLPMQIPGIGDQTSVAVPAAIKASEAALVDVRSTLAGGGGSAGTGIVLSSDGLVLTNNHVIDGATSVAVTDVGNRQSYRATVLGYDVRDDVAVLRLEGATGLAVASLGGAASVGDKVYAVGNAEGLGGAPTVTAGTITGTGRSITAGDRLDGTSETLHGLLETDASLISGDSGGALTSANGEVIGVDTASSTQTQLGGRGYAIPVATALAIAHQIIDGTAAPRVHLGPSALLGVRISTATSAANGARVSYVAPGDPAAAAGITAGSRITAIGAKAVTTPRSLRLAMTGHHPGDRVSVTWVDPSGATRTARAVLVTGPAQ